MDPKCRGNGIFNFFITNRLQKIKIYSVVCRSEDSVQVFQYNTQLFFKYVFQNTLQTYQYTLYCSLTCLYLAKGTFRNS